MKLKKGAPVKEIIDQLEPPCIVNFGKGKEHILNSFVKELERCGLSYEINHDDPRYAFSLLILEAH